MAYLRGFLIVADYSDNALNFEGVGTRTLTGEVSLKATRCCLSNVLLGLLKRYFMFLVEPLIPHEIYERLAPLRGASAYACIHSR